jgi:CheY-like chemotaxis protein
MQGHRSKGCSSQPWPQRPLRLLVVEDNVAIRQAVEMFFRLLGYHACFAENAQVALETAAGERFDVLLTDLRLPDGDGWELLRRLKEADHCPPRAIAMSAWGSDAAQAKSRAAGFEAHLVKPFTPQELQAALHEATTPAN